MTTVAIICEYNPFHNGHLHHIDKIREEFGNDTRIIAIMSGNFTQRGEMAIADKGLRAKCAVLNGVNLVLELPFPYSISSAELFAAAGVHIADSLGIVDYLSFGSECGDIEKLTEVASVLVTNEYEQVFERLLQDKDRKNLGHPKLCEKAYEIMTGTVHGTVGFTPNNILALEYIKSIMRLSSSLKPHTIRRVGADYSEETITSAEYQSATAIRNAVVARNISALEYMPHNTKQLFLDAIADGEFPCDSSALDAAVISSLRLNSSENVDNIHDTQGGLYNRLRAASFEASNIKTLISLTETKRFTTARIKRSIWYSFFGVTSSEVKELPLYTQLLATDEVGRTMLKESRKRGVITILTKPTATKKLCDAALRQWSRSTRADSVFQLSKPKPEDGNFAMRFTPFVKS